jgi:glutamate-1-semialdehyde 2,1-aminomutase/spore coat polysaccharide biosynthesis protein SpsF
MGTTNDLGGKVRVVAIVQARMGSSRLPGKVMADVSGKPLIDRLLARLWRAKRLDAIWLATSTEAANDVLAAHVTEKGVPVFRGSEDDVLGRFAATAQEAEADIVVRLTGDCPFVDPDLVDAVVDLLASTDADWAGNVIHRRWPDGLDVEAMTRSALDRAEREAKHEYCRMHVTPYLHGEVPAGVEHGSFKCVHLNADADFSHLRWTVDEPEDLEFVRRVTGKMPDNFGWLDLVALTTRDPVLLRINRHIEMNEGAKKDFAKLSQKKTFARSNQFFARATSVIPLASQTFSKSYQQWVKGSTPLFITRGRGARCFDIDGNDYIDYVLGLLPTILGHCDPDVDTAIQDQLARGITFSLPSPLETELAERIIRHVPCAEMVRFGKNGSDATTAAVRLARAFTGRDKVLVGGYHGWHDWYIGSTTRDLGVPDAIKSLTGKFYFNDAVSLERVLIAERDKIAAVILEPAGVVIPDSGFLEYVRELTQRFGVVLIFDEIITGFRIDLGGAQKYYDVIPDLATFGKAIANGMPLSVITGRRDIMTLMEDVFISGTFGGETLSIAAAIATVDKLERCDVPAALWKLGARLSTTFNQQSRNHGLGEIVSVGGPAWWPLIKVSPQSPVTTEVLTSLLRQEFVANGLLLAATFNLCLAHDDQRIEADTTRALARSFAALHEALNSSDPTARLRGDPIQPTFRVR